MATIKTSDGKGTEVIVTASDKIPTSVNDLSDKQIDKTLGGVNKQLDIHKDGLKPHGQAIVEDAQALIHTTRKHEIFQKLIAFARNLPADELASTSRSLAERLTGIDQDLQVHVSNLSDYIRASIYNYLTNAHYRDLSSDVWRILRDLAEEIDDTVRDEKPKKSKHHKKPHASHAPLSSYTVEQHTTVAPVGPHGAVGTVTEIHHYSDHEDREEEAVTAIVKRFNKLLKKLSEKKEYQQLVENFFDYSDQLWGIFADVSEKSKQSEETKQLHALVDQSFEFLASFVGEKLVRKYRKYFTRLYNKLQDDEELKKWRYNARSYVREAIKGKEHPDDGQLRKLVSEGRRILGKYREPFNDLYDIHAKIAKKFEMTLLSKTFNKIFHNSVLVLL